MGWGLDVSSTGGSVSISGSLAMPQAVMFATNKMLKKKAIYRFILSHSLVCRGKRDHGQILILRLPRPEPLQRHVCFLRILNVPASGCIVINSDIRFISIQNLNEVEFIANKSCTVIREVIEPLTDF